jgi:hypothetical protein
MEIDSLFRRITSNHPATIHELPPTQIFDVQTLEEKIASLAIHLVPHDPAKLRQRMLMEVCAAAPKTPGGAHASRRAIKQAIFCVRNTA